MSFETTAHRCIEEGLVGGEGFTVDGQPDQGGCEQAALAEGSEQVDWQA